MPKLKKFCDVTNRGTLLASLGRLKFNFVFLCGIPLPA